MGLNLLIISQYFYPENFRINDLVQGLVARGHKVTVLTGQPNYPSGNFTEGYGWIGPKQEKLFGAEIIRVPLIPRGNGSALRLIVNYLSFVIFACFAVLFRLKGKFDAIFVFQTSPVTVGIPAILARKKFQAPIFFWVLDLWPQSLLAASSLRSTFVLNLVDKMVVWIHSHCFKILVSSKSFVDEISKHGKKVEEIKYFPNWVEPEYLSDSINYNFNKEYKSDFTIVFAGNIGVAQDFDSLLAAMKQVSILNPQVKWKIAGSGRMLADVRREIRILNLEACVTFLGQLSPNDAMNLLKSADALLVSLKADPVFDLTVPGKVQSYLAAGRPILAMLNGEGAQIINDAHAGFVTEAGNVDGFVNNILKLATLSFDEREQLGNNGREFAERHFNREILFEQLDEWLHEAVI